MCLNGVIDPQGLFNGDRLRRCSNVAQLHWPRLFSRPTALLGSLSWNGREDAPGLSHVSPLPTEGELRGYLEEYATNFLLFVYKADGQLWGQWDTKDAFLPRYKTSSDRRSPIPPKIALADWRRQYREQFRCYFRNLSGIFRKVFSATRMGEGEGVGLRWVQGMGLAVGVEGADKGDARPEEHTPPPPPGLWVQPAEQSRGNDGEPMATPSAANGEPIEVAVGKPLLPATLLIWQRDESYALLMAAWRAAKPDAIDEDFARNHKHWVKLDGGQRQQAIANLRESVRLGLRTSTTLGYWLREDYKRPVDVPAPTGGASVQARNQQRRDNVNQMTKALLKKRL